MATLAEPVSKYGLMESTLAGVAVGGATGFTYQSIANTWNPTAGAPTVLRSFQSKRAVKVIAGPKPTSVATTGLFFGGVVGAYVLTEKLSGAIRGRYDAWNGVPASLVAGGFIGARAGCMPTAAYFGGAICLMGAFLKGSGAGLGQEDAREAYFYAGRGDEGRRDWLERKTTWLKAPYVDPAAAGEGGDDY
eukprot:COSAG01_NODE_7301_length_3261_cov_16.753953_3_plen_191_part_00